MFNAELVKLTALWDAVDLEMCSIPTVLELINSHEVIRRLYRRKAERAKWRIKNVNFMVIENSAQERLQLLRCRIKLIRRSFNRELRVAHVLGKSVIGSERLKSIRDHRVRFFAHNLGLQSPLVMAEPYTPPKHGHERRLLSTSTLVANALNGIIRNAWFDYQGCSVLGMSGL
jgi:hypothetical protein